jgi:hypothetical protein
MGNILTKQVAGWLVRVYNKNPPPDISGRGLLFIRL